MTPNPCCQAGQLSLMVGRPSLAVGRPSLAVGRPSLAAVMNYSAAGYGGQPHQ
ncbi:MAG: hypothetical protein WCD80_12405 [Desulfobaccales bacterium]